MEGGVLFTGDHAMPQDGDPVTQGLHLVQLVGYQKNGSSLVADLMQCLKQPIFLMIGDAGSGFVQDQQPGITSQQSQELQLLALADGQLLQGLFRIQMEVDLSCQFIQTPALTGALVVKEPVRE